MKKTLSCILAMLLCLTALPANAAEPSYTVDEIRKQITAPWQTTYETKWREIEVDVLPTVPDIQTIPVLMVRPAFWCPNTLADVAWSAEVSDKTSSFRLYAGDIWKEERDATKGIKYDYISQFFYAPLDSEKAYASTNDLTISKMLETVQGILNIVEHSHFGIDTFHTLFIRTSGYAEKGTTNYLLPATISMEIYTTLRDIPIYGHVISSVESRSDFEFSYNPSLHLTMRNSHSYQLLGCTVYEAAELASDVPLCSFDAVREAIEKEIEDGHIRAIYSVDLGYALYNVPGARHKYNEAWEKDAEFYSVPTWRVVCAYSKQAKKELPAGTIENPEPSLYYKTLYVNAQTGALINPNDNRSGCGDYPGVITWEEVK